MNRRSRRRYTYIIEITIQSSALYTLALLVQAITGFTFNDSLKFPSSTVLNAALYTDVVAWIMTVSSLTTLFMSFSSFVTIMLALRPNLDGRSASIGQK